MYFNTFHSTFSYSLDSDLHQDQLAKLPAIALQWTKDNDSQWFGTP